MTGAPAIAGMLAAMTRVTVGNTGEVSARRPGAAGTEAAVACGPDPRRRRAYAAGLLHDLIRATQEPRVRPADCVTSGTGALIGCPLPAQQEGCYLLAVHKDVDDLCTTALSLCMRGGNAGDSAARMHPGQAFYLGKAPAAPVHAEKPGIVHTRVAIDDK